MHTIYTGLKNKMKSLFFLVALICCIKIGLSQTRSLVGAWYWSDSTQQTSIFFKSGARILMHTGPKGEAILTKNLKEGTYTLKNNQLTVKWDDGEVQNNYIKFIAKSSFQVTFLDKQSKNQKRDFVFRKVVDEEVKKE